MNSILQIKLNFSKEQNTAGGGGKNLRANTEVSVEKIDELIGYYMIVFQQTGPHGCGGYVKRLYEKRSDYNKNQQEREGQRFGELRYLFVYGMSSVP